MPAAQQAQGMKNGVALLFQEVLAAVKNRLNLAENPIKGIHGRKGPAQSRPSVMVEGEDDGTLQIRMADRRLLA